jgi:hypothetical protein
MTVEHLMYPPRRRLSWEMLNEVNERLTELKHMGRVRFRDQPGVGL